MLIVSYSALRERIVVIEPAPAIRGKAIGNIDPPPGRFVFKQFYSKYHFHCNKKYDERSGNSERLDINSKNSKQGAADK